MLFVLAFCNYYRSFLILKTTIGYLLTTDNGLFFKDILVTFFILLTSTDSVFQGFCA